MKEKVIIPPEVIQLYRRALLEAPLPQFRDTSKDLWRVYIWIVRKLIKKASYNPIRLKKCLELEQEFLDLYEQTKIKEKERQEQKEHHTQEPFYSFKETGRNYRKLFSRLKLKSYNLSTFVSGQNDEIY